MQIEQVPFDTWFYMSRKYQTLDIIRTINPFDGGFYVYGESFLQIHVRENVMWIAQVVGKGTDFMSALRKSALKSGVIKIQWYTAENNRQVNAFAKYWKADLIETIPNYYGDISANYWCLDLTKPNSRLGI